MVVVIVELSVRVLENSDEWRSAVYSKIDVQYSR